MMVEKLWHWMGPQEHAWFSQFMPDVRSRYPLETARVNPWNVKMATLFYNAVPTFNSAVMDKNALERHPVPLEEVVPIWLEARKQHGLPTNCWQLTAELISAYHTRDALHITKQLVYHSNVGEQTMDILQALCPDEDWPLALACAGIPSEHLHIASCSDNPEPKAQQALAWLQWWLEKSPNCLDNLAWSWVREIKDFIPKIDPTTDLVFNLCLDAHDPRDTFYMARKIYGDMLSKGEPTLPSEELQEAFSLGG
jgi:hypothetical protein